MTTTDIEKADREGQPGGELVPAEGGGGEGAGARTALLEPSENPRAEAIRTRIVLPLLLPIASAAALFFYVINLSRALLAGGEWGSLAIASILVLTILGMVAWMSAHPNLRTSSLALLTVALLALIGAAGLTSFGPSQPPPQPAATGYVEPKGAPVATIEVDALATLKFQADNFDTAPGINEIKYVLGGGTHTLVFEEKEFAGFMLAVNPGHTEDSGKVDLKSGQTYTIYCTIPGHRAAGMEATITVS